MPDEERESELVKFVHAGEDLEVVFGGFSEANAGVEDDGLRFDAASDEFSSSEVEPVPDLDHGIDVSGIVLHGQRGPLDVHADYSGLGLSAEIDHLRIEGESGDVVDDLCSQIEGATRNFAFICINGDGNVDFWEEEFKDREDSGELLGFPHRGGIGASGFSSEIDDVGPLLDEG